MRRRVAGFSGEASRTVLGAGLTARIERFNRTLKTECTRVIQVPFVRKNMLAELLAYAGWFNGQRPHQGLQGRTPEEIYHRLRPRFSHPRIEPRAC